MKKNLLMALALFCNVAAIAQNSTSANGEQASLAERISYFGTHNPQEKVYLHLDNTCYFLGDTLWYKAYVMRSDKNTPSPYSKILYVELLSPDGFVVERQQVPVSMQGNGFGRFALQDSLYGGYYEVRAYTRWQLNFGCYEHEHPSLDERRFYNKAMAKDFFRDYDKLYSRVVPVYDRPTTAGTYNKNMTTRPLRRYFSTNQQRAREMNVLFFPEGGNLVAGTTNRVAFETQDEVGRHVVASGVVKDETGKKVAQLKTTFRGKGIFELTCGTKTGKVYTASVTMAGQTKEFTLPEVRESGCVMRVDEKNGTATVNITGKNLSPESLNTLGITVMRGGKIAHQQKVTLDAQGHAVINIPTADLLTGVNNITLYDEKGEIFADRLFFVNHHEYEKASLTVSGLKKEYAPFEAINLNFQMKEPREAEFSLSVRDHSTEEASYDDSNILTEMLLGSEVKGFIENPAYFFEANDATHRYNLDLLLMVQGWRRYVWRDMAGLSGFKFRHFPEQAQVLEGCVNKTISYDDPRREKLTPDEIWDEHDAIAALSEQTEDEREGLIDNTVFAQQDGPTVPGGETANNYANNNPDESSGRTNDYNRNEIGLMANTLKKEVNVEATFALGEGNEAEVNDQQTKKGEFKLLMPQFFGECITSLGAFDSEEAREKIDRKRQTPFTSEEAYPAYYVKRNLFFPNFVKMYSFYQENSPEYTDETWGVHGNNKGLDGDHLLSEVMVGARHGGLRKVDYSKPAFVIDAYEMYNNVADYGLNSAYFVFDNFYEQIKYALCASMGTYRDNSFLQKRIDGKAINVKHGANPYYFSEGEKEKNWRLRRLDKIYVYTDYEPRHEGSWKYYGENNPDFVVDIHLIPNDGLQYTFRDRHYRIPGYAECEEFYSPDYSTRPLPSTKDYRRTLYWAPVVKTDAEGKASVTLYNNATGKYINVSAEGITQDGLPVVNNP